MSGHGWIYCIIDCTNDKEYIGQTMKSVKNRFKQHMNNKDSYIGRAINAHGVENFIVVILKECYSKAELDYWERHFIKYRDTMVPNGYNLTEGGEGIEGHSFSDEARARKSASTTGDNNPFFGKHHTDENKVASSEKMRGESPHKNLLAEVNRLLLSYNALVKLLEISQAYILSK